MLCVLTFRYADRECLAGSDQASRLQNDISKVAFARYKCNCSNPWHRWSKFVNGDYFFCWASAFLWFNCLEKCHINCFTIVVLCSCYTLVICQYSDIDLWLHINQHVTVTMRDVLCCLLVPEYVFLKISADGLWACIWSRFRVILMITLFPFTLLDHVHAVVPSTCNWHLSLCSYH